MQPWHGLLLYARYGRHPAPVGAGLSSLVKLLSGAADGGGDGRAVCRHSQCAVSCVHMGVVTVELCAHSQAALCDGTQPGALSSGLYMPRHIAGGLSTASAAARRGRWPDAGSWPALTATPARGPR